MSTDQSPSEVDLRSYVPESWRQTHEQVWIDVYRMVGVAIEHTRPRVPTVVGRTAVILSWMSTPKMAVETAFEPNRDGQIQINAKTPDGATWAMGPVALIMTPIFPEDDPSTSAVRQRCRETAGLISLIAGHLLVFQQLESYVLNIDTGVLGPTAVKVADTTWFFDVDTSEERRAGWTMVANAIELASDRDRILLSLRWLDDAKRSAGVDAFLKFWFALETLAMPDSSDIAPLVGLVATAYGADSAEVKTRFGIGRMFGLRSRVVHDGLIFDPPPQLLFLAQGLYLDALLSALGLQSAGHAQTVLDNHDGAVDALFKA